MMGEVLTINREPTLRQRVELIRAAEVAMRECDRLAHLCMATSEADRWHEESNDHLDLACDHRTKALAELSRLTKLSEDDLREIVG